jgi:hypothetical protein
MYSASVEERALISCSLCHHTIRSMSHEDNVTSSWRSSVLPHLQSASDAPLSLKFYETSIFSTYNHLKWVSAFSSSAKVSCTIWVNKAFQCSLTRIMRVSATWANGSCGLSGLAVMARYKVDLECFVRILIAVSV